MCRWLDIPFTREESLQADKTIKITCEFSLLSSSASFLSVSSPSFSLLLHFSLWAMCSLPEICCNTNYVPFLPCFPSRVSFPSSFLVFPLAFLPHTFLFSFHFLSPFTFFKPVSPQFFFQFFLHFFLPPIYSFPSYPPPPSSSFTSSHQLVLVWIPLVSVSWTVFVSTGRQRTCLAGQSTPRTLSLPSERHPRAL